MRNRYLYIEGTASRSDHQDFFKSNFAMEAHGAGYIVTSSRNEAAHTLRFRVVADNSDPDYEQYVVTVSLHRNEDDAQLISFDFYFSSINEMYSYTRTLVLNATANIPLPLLTGEEDQWKNKWLYLRASFDYPVTFYLLQPTGLQGGIGLYNVSPPRVSPIGHEIMAMPGATVGVEFQRYNFLSVELNIEMNMGDTRNNYFVNTALGLELKSPIKFRHLMLVPYGAFSYTFVVSPIFTEFPPYAAGGGAQLCVRAGKRGSVFIDAKYMFSFAGDAVMRNPYLDFPEGPQRIYPEPAVIRYKRSQLGIGVGYKFGILDRKR